MLILYVSITLAPVLSFKTWAKFPISPICLAQIVSSCFLTVELHEVCHQLHLMILLAHPFHSRLIRYNQQLESFLQKYEQHLLDRINCFWLQILILITFPLQHQQPQIEFYLKVIGIHNLFTTS